MIAEEYNKIIAQTPELTDSKGKTISTILGCMKQAVLPFKKVCCQTDLHRPLNENALTQIYVEQIGFQIKSYPIGVSNQYSNIFLKPRGIPDFYFYEMEAGKTHKPLLVVESKRLPAPPPKSREQEYVKGNSNNNGGIERYKTEKHGKGLDECGMIGFVEKETFAFWHKSINAWISDLSVSSNFWQTDEHLETVERKEDFMLLKSIAHRKSQKDIRLHHLWITIQ